jgi:hypothetical protein
MKTYSGEFKKPRIQEAKKSRSQEASGPRGKEFRVVRRRIKPGILFLLASAGFYLLSLLNS